MTHEIKNKHGKYIEEVKIRDEICYAIEHNMKYTYYEGKKIDIKTETNKDGRFTQVKIEGI